MKKFVEDDNDVDVKDLKNIVKNKIEKQIAVKINDTFGTIIYIGKNENKEKAIKKYLKDLEEYRLANITNFNLGALKPKTNTKTKKNGNNRHEF